MEIVSADVEAYLAALAGLGRRRGGPAPDRLQKSMEAFARERRFETGDGRTIDFPIIGPLVGRLIFLLAKLSHARRIFEFGSGFGYSSLWFARALGSKGEIFLTDGNSENL